MIWRWCSYCTSLPHQTPQLMLAPGLARWSRTCRHDCQAPVLYCTWSHPPRRPSRRPRFDCYCRSFGDHPKREWRYLSSGVFLSLAFAKCGSHRISNGMLGHVCNANVFTRVPPVKLQTWPYLSPGDSDLGLSLEPDLDPCQEKDKILIYARWPPLLCPLTPHFDGFIVLDIQRSSDGLSRTVAEVRSIREGRRSAFAESGHSCIT